MESKKLYFQVYKESYTAEFSCIKKSSKDEKYDMCRSDFVISHVSGADVHCHMTRLWHMENVKISENNKTKLNKFFNPNNTQDGVYMCRIALYIILN